MRRYQFLEEEEIFEAFNKVRNAFLAAKDGDEVDTVIDGLLTRDEKLKIGRRIIIAEALLSGMSLEETIRSLRIGKTTAMHVSRRIEKYSKCFELLERRSKAVEKEYRKREFSLSGG